MARLRGHANDGANYGLRMLKADPNVTGNCQLGVKFCKREESHILMYKKV